FSADAMDGKTVCKSELLETFELDAGDDRPLIGMIARLCEQKGFDIVEEVFERLVKDHVRFVVLGTGDAKHEKFWRDAAKRHPKHVAARVGFDEVLAHKIEAGSD